MNKLISLIFGAPLPFNTVQQVAFALLRIAIGWHFLREGWVKLSQPDWTAYYYLMASKGPFQEMMYGFAESEPWMAFINVAIPWSLFLSGLGLMLGLFTRFSCLVGIGLLGMFYIAMPPWDYTLSQQALDATNDFATMQSSMSTAQWAGNFMTGNEGNYIVVNKNLIEMLAIGVLLITGAGHYFGVDGAIAQYTADNTEE